ncbi:MAG: hypothetical protein H7Y20_10710 [Bryobacteraceae bacterium]|nr:hypothetical protein [Bryobacteraceae bacterium]
MKVYFRIIGLSALAACAASAQPVVSAALNNASYALPGQTNSGIARGSLFAVFGTGLATSNLTATAFPLSANMGGTSVRVTVGTTSVDALMIYTTAGQIGAMLPSNTPEGAGSLVASLNGQASRPLAITVVRSAFGIFTANQQGSGPGSIQIANSATDQPTVALNRPARPGQTMILWGTGLGPTTASEAAGPVPGDLAGVNVQVYVGGRLATVSYKGRSGCCASIDQIAFVVPDGVEGCYVPVVVRTGDVVSNFASIAVARTGNTCSDVNGLSGQDILTAQANGNSRTGNISLIRSKSKFSVEGFTLESNTDSGFGYFSRYDLGQLLTAQGTGGNTFTVSLGACSVATYKASTDPGVGFVDPVKPTILDAGPQITIIGPNGTKQLLKRGELYTAELGGGTSGLPGVPGVPAATPLYLEPGSYKINNGSGGTGANAVGAFSVDFTLPQQVTWTNDTAVDSVTRSSGQQITWSGGSADSIVQIIGFSTTKDSSSVFNCTERASVGRFTIPSYVLLLLPPTTADNIGFLAVGGSSATQRFTAPGLDSGYVSASSLNQKTVTYR